MASLENDFTTLPNRSVEILDCIKDRDKIQVYKQYAMEQVNHYEHQHPWDSCKKGDILYIVRSDTLILSWMKVEIETYEDLHIGYILNFATAKKSI